MLSDPGSRPPSLLTTHTAPPPPARPAEFVCKQSISLKHDFLKQAVGAETQVVLILKRRRQDSANRRPLFGELGLQASWAVGRGTGCVSV